MATGGLQLEGGLPAGEWWDAAPLATCLQLLQLVPGQPGHVLPDASCAPLLRLPLQKVWAEFSRQTKMALAMLAAFMLLSWAVRRRPPWQF